MKELIIEIFLALFVTLLGIFVYIWQEHRKKLNELKPRILEILQARISALENGHSSSNIFTVSNEELQEISLYISLFKRIKLIKELKNYEKLNVWVNIRGNLYYKNPQEMLKCCKSILALLQ